jgi:dihydrodipicolinate reductase
MGSTGLDDDLPAKPDCVIVKAPNFALPIVGLIALLPEITRYLGRLGVTPYSLIESHQQAKTGTPGTAVAFQQALGVHAFTSVREPAIQVKLGVPPEHLAGHGYHWMTFEGGAVTLGINTQVNGRAAYAPGFVQLAEVTLGRMHTGFAQIRKGVYTSGEILGLDKLKITFNTGS